MTDIELARAFERGEVPPRDFHHASHLRVAWVYLRECRSVADATDRMAALLRRFAASVDKSEKYHHTMTVFWMLALAGAGSTMRDAAASEVLRAYPRLLDKELPLAFYSRERLFSDAARLSWVAPDRQPLSADATAFHPADPSSDAPNRPVSRRSR